MPAVDEIGARAGTPGAPVQVIYVRLPADAPRQPGEPKAPRAPAKKTARRSPPKGRSRKQETNKMTQTIKLAAIIVLTLALYAIIGVYAPFLGHVAVTFPLLAAIPAVGAWACFLTFKGIICLATFGWLGKKLA